MNQLTRNGVLLAEGTQGLTLFRPATSFILLTLAILLAACGSNPSEGEADGQGSSANFRTLPPVSPAWTSKDNAMQISAVRSDEKALEIDLSLPASQGFPSEDLEWFACLPAEAHPQAQIMAYTVGGENKQWIGPDGATSGTLSPLIDPKATLSCTQEGYLRQWPMWRIKVRKRFWDPAREQKKAAGQPFSATVRWNLDTPTTAPQTLTDVSSWPLPQQEKGLQRVASHLVINPADLGRWAQASPPLNDQMRPEPLDPATLAPGAQRWARLSVSTEGLVRLTPQTLGKAGFEASRLDRIRVYADRKPVPVWSEPAETDQAGVYFYGWPRQSEYGTEQVYWITQSEQAPAQAMESQPAPSDQASQPLEQIWRRARVDRDHEPMIEHGNFLSIQGIEWVDAPILEQEPIELPLTVHAPLPSPDQGLAAQLCIFQDGPLKGDDVELALKYNGRELTRLTLSNQVKQKVYDLTLPLEQLQATTTVLTLEVTKGTSATLEESSQLWLDWFEVRYPARPTLVQGVLTLDTDTVTSSGQQSLPPVRDLGLGNTAQAAALAIDTSKRRVEKIQPAPGGRLGGMVRDSKEIALFDLSQVPTPQPQPFVFASSDLWQSPFDYLIVTHPDFRPALEPLLKLNEQRGLTTRVVEIQDVYDWFSDGMISPVAIRLLLAHLVTQLGNGAPDYALLVGDCNSDFLGLTRSGVPNYVPSYSYKHGQETWASETWFTLLCGSDNLPDVMLGRLSVASLEDARSVIEKTVRYQTQFNPGLWRARMTYVADNHESFRSTAEDLRLKDTPAGIDARLIHLDQMALEDNWYIPENQVEMIWAQERTWMKVSEQATVAIKNTFNDGTAFLDYFGHGSPNIWTDERIWFGGDSPNRDSQFLKSEGRYAFVCNYTCNSGAIDYPMPRWNICISEDLMRTPDGGAVALFVPSGPGTTPVHVQMAEQWRRVLFEDNLRQLGCASTLTRARYALSGAPSHMLMMFGLLGDPALDLQLTQRWQTLEASPATWTAQTQAITISAQDLLPRRGKVQAFIENEQGEVLWQNGTLDYNGGHVEQTIELPATLKDEPTLRFVLYGWGVKEKKDWVASAWVARENPALRVEKIAPVRLDEGRVKIIATLKQDGPEPMQQVELKVSESRSPAQFLDTQKVDLPAAQAVDVELVARLDNVSSQPMVFEVQAIAPFAPTDPQVPQTIRKNAILWPAQTAEANMMWLAPALSAWQEGDAPGNRANLKICALAPAQPQGQAWLQWLSADGTEKTSQTLNFTPHETGLEAVVTIQKPQLLNRAQPDDELALCVTGKQTSQTQVLERLPLSKLPRPSSRLRIQPKSIQIIPAEPTDGQTIFVHLVAENIGSLPSASVTPALFDADPRLGGANKLQAQSGLRTPSIPSLAPGRSVPVTLRWDPIKNAGVQTVWIDLQPGKNRSKDERAEQVDSYRMYVRTKSKLRRPRAPWVTQTAQQKLDNIYVLHTQIENTGETPARMVEVNFYLTPDKTPQNLIQTVVVEELAAQKRKEVSIEWPWDPEKYPGRTLQDIKPSVEILLKGSTQRFQNEPASQE